MKKRLYRNTQILKPYFGATKPMHKYDLRTWRGDGWMWLLCIGRNYYDLQEIKLYRCVHGKKRKRGKSYKLFETYKNSRRGR